MKVKMKIQDLIKGRDEAAAEAAKFKAAMQAAETMYQRYDAAIKSVEGVEVEVNLDVLAPGPVTEEALVEDSSEEPKQKTSKKAKEVPSPKKAAKEVPSPKKAAKGTATVKSKKTSTPHSRKNAKAGRAAVASGERPTLKKAMAQVMGTKILNASEIVQALKDKDWLPASDKPQQYISYMLSSNKDIFERTERRGYYRVIPSQLSQAKPKKGAPKKKGDDLDASLMNNFGADIVNGNVDDDPFGVNPEV